MLSSNSVDLYSSFFPHFFSFLLSSLLRVTNIILLPPGWTLILETSTRVWRTELQNQSQLQFCQAHWNTEMKSNRKQSSENMDSQDFLQYCQKLSTCNDSASCKTTFSSNNFTQSFSVSLCQTLSSLQRSFGSFILIYKTVQGPCTVFQSSWATPACFFSHSVLDLLMCSGSLS